jgi:hydrogenase nickel incorporation protein HypA/HybF
MHELSIAHELVRIVLDGLELAGAVHVIAVRLKVGVLSGVVPDALQFCYDVVVRDTPLEGSRLEIELLRTVVHCSTCNRDVEPREAWSFCCPDCDAPSASIVQGQELNVDTIEVEEVPAAPG